MGSPVAHHLLTNQKKQVPAFFYALCPSMPSLWGRESFGSHVADWRGFPVYRQPRLQPPSCLLPAPHGQGHMLLSMVPFQRVDGDVGGLRTPPHAYSDSPLDAHCFFPCLADYVSNDFWWIFNVPVFFPPWMVFSVMDPCHLPVRGGGLWPWLLPPREGGALTLAAAPFLVHDTGTLSPMMG